ncbi:MAG: hypothetical protein A3K65_02130 [Euryarchaeota archaeon RBG_16_68_12]|nr:MAG: hypothetical protein A3K65_02130 [Euryarchaeota archaeon RBG_16_68_12]
MYYPPPAPKRTSTVLIVVVIVVVLAVVITIVLAAVLYVMMSGLVGPDVNTPPAIAFTRSLTGGNATLTVAGISREASISLFTFRLEVDSARSPPLSFSGSGVPRLVSIAGTTYPVTWTDEDTDGALSLTDTVLITGDGGPLGPGSYALRLTWVPTGTEIVVSTWTV